MQKHPSQCREAQIIAVPGETQAWNEDSARSKPTNGVQGLGAFDIELCERTLMGELGLCGLVGESWVGRG
jgi:hypothetical protein